MKNLFLMLLLLPLPLFAGERVEYYGDLGRTSSLSYLYEGLWPMLEGCSGSCYRVAYTHRELPREFLFLNENGKADDNGNGWSKLTIAYNSQGKPVEIVFEDRKGRLAFNKEIGFAMEKRFYEGGGIRREFYDQNGGLMRLSPENTLKNKISRPHLLGPGHRIERRKPLP